MSKDNLIELKNPEPFIDDPITEIHRLTRHPLCAKGRFGYKRYDASNRLNSRCTNVRRRLGGMPFSAQEIQIKTFNFFHSILETESFFCDRFGILHK